MANTIQQPQGKKSPERQCMGCNRHRPKVELLRVLRTPEGQIEIDVTGKKSGRGAYLCKSAACLKKARKSRRLERSLGCGIPDEVYDRMEAELARTEASAGDQP